MPQDQTKFTFDYQKEDAPELAKLHKTVPTVPWDESCPRIMECLARVRNLQEGQ